MRVVCVRQATTYIFHDPCTGSVHDLPKKVVLYMDIINKTTKVIRRDSSELLNGSLYLLYVYL